MLDPCSHGVLIDESTKCYDCMPEMGVGGATTWDDYQSAEEANHKVRQVAELSLAFRSMTSNVLMDMMLTPAEKVSRLRGLVDGFGERVMMDEQKAADDRPNAWQRLAGALHKRTKATPELVAQPGFKAFKDAAGAWRWIAIHSNNLRDREGEVFPLAVHKEYVAHVDSSGELPELWLWHTPGSKCGKAEMVDVTSEGFVVSAGRFDPGRESAAERLAAMPDLGVSHGFRHTGTDRDKAFRFYRTFEISPLPASSAANQYTAFAAQQEESPMFSPAKKAYLTSILGPVETDALETRITAAASKAAEQGIAFKDVLEALGSASELASPAAPPSAPIPPAAAAPDLEAALTKALEPLTAGLAQLQATVAEHSKALDDARTKALPGNMPFIASAIGIAPAAGDPVVAARDDAAKKDASNAPEWMSGYRDALTRVLTGAAGN